MEIKFNVNNFVKVKLTGYGKEILKERYNNLNESIKERGGMSLGEFSIKVDENGYTKMQMWEMMNIFGHTLSNGGKLPFETEIIIEAPTIK